MPNLYLLTSSLLFLIIGNFFVWFFPFLLEEFDLFKPQGVIAYIFSSSYWFPIVLIIFDPRGYIPPNILVEKIDYAALASLCAGLGFVIAYFISKGKLTRGTLDLGIPINIGKRLLELIIVLNHMVGLALLVYCFFEAQKWIGVSSRITFYALDPYWYSNILPIAGFSIGIANFLFFLSPFCFNNFLSFIMFANTSFIIFVNGFDGGRRYAAFVIFFSIIGFIFGSKVIAFQKEKLIRQKKIMFRFLLILSLIFIMIMSTARNNVVGWNIQVIGPSIVDNYYFLGSILSPTSTLHVNTQMAYYIDQFGTQGYTNYLQAIGNTLMPEFLLGYYVFGPPLVTRLHHELGWYGQDFGVLAEGIYSGGLSGTFCIHLILGIIANNLYANWSSGRIFSGLFYLSFILAMLNSVRSDFMNFLKVWIYIGIGLSLIYFALKILSTNTVLDRRRAIINATR